MTTKKKSEFWEACTFFATVLGLPTLFVFAMFFLVPLPSEWGQESAASAGQDRASRDNDHRRIPRRVHNDPRSNGAEWRETYVISRQEDFDDSMSIIMIPYVLEIPDDDCVWYLRRRGRPEIRARRSPSCKEEHVGKRVDIECVRDVFGEVDCDLPASAKPY